MLEMSKELSMIGINHDRDSWSTKKKIKKLSLFHGN